MMNNEWPPLCSKCKTNKSNPHHEIFRLSLYCDECWDSDIRFRYLVTVLPTGGVATVPADQIEATKAYAREKFGPHVTLSVEPVERATHVIDWVM